MSLWRIAFAFLLLLVPSTMLTIERVARYAASLHKDDMRHMTKEDIVCSRDVLLVKPGNYLEPLSAALALCPEFDPSRMARSANTVSVWSGSASDPECHSHNFDRVAEVIGNQCTVTERKP